MAIAAFHSCLSMHIREHLQEGLSFKQRSPLITKTIFPGGHTMVVHSDKVPLMAAKTGVLQGPRDIVAVFPVTVETIPHMAGLTVFLVKVGVGLAEGLFDKPSFPCPRGHRLIKQAIVTFVATDTAAGPIVTGCWMIKPFRVISVA